MSDLVVVNDQIAINACGDLHLSTPYLTWFTGDEKADLDGEFSAAELRAIAAYMEAGGHE